MQLFLEIPQSSMAVIQFLSRAFPGRPSLDALGSFPRHSRGPSWTITGPTLQVSWASSRPDSRPAWDLPSLRLLPGSSLSWAFRGPSLTLLWACPVPSLASPRLLPEILPGPTLSILWGTISRIMVKGWGPGKKFLPAYVLMS